MTGKNITESKLKTKFILSKLISEFKHSANIYLASHYVLGPNLGK